MFSSILSIFACSLVILSAHGKGDASATKRDSAIEKVPENNLTRMNETSQNDSDTVSEVPSSSNTLTAEESRAAVRDFASLLARLMFPSYMLADGRSDQIDEVEIPLEGSSLVDEPIEEVDEVPYWQTTVASQEKAANSEKTDNTQDVDKDVISVGDAAAALILSLHPGTFGLSSVPLSPKKSAILARDQW